MITKQELDKMIGEIYRNQQAIQSSVHSLEKQILKFNAQFDLYMEEHKNEH